jgi:hypothetical protein
VALSRIRSLNGLYLSSFNPRKIKTNPTVSAFYKTIPEITEEIAQKTKETLDIFENTKITSTVSVSTVSASTVSASTVSALSKPQGGGGLKVVLL